MRSHQTIILVIVLQYIHVHVGVGRTWPSMPGMGRVPCCVPTSILGSRPGRCWGSQWLLSRSRGCCCLLTHISAQGTLVLGGGWAGRLHPGRGMGRWGALSWEGDGQGGFRPRRGMGGGTLPWEGDGRGGGDFGPGRGMVGASSWGTSRGCRLPLTLPQACLPQSPGRWRQGSSEGSSQEHAHTETHSAPSTPVTENPTFIYLALPPLPCESSFQHQPAAPSEAPGWNLHSQPAASPNHMHVPHVLHTHTHMHMHTHAQPCRQTHMHIRMHTRAVPGPFGVPGLMSLLHLHTGLPHTQPSSFPQAISTAPLVMCTCPVPCLLFRVRALQSRCGRCLAQEALSSVLSPACKLPGVGGCVSFIFGFQFL